MSSFSVSQSQETQFLPPQSAQPRPSLFGGPSSDATLQPSSQPEPPRSSLFGGISQHHGNLEPVSEADPMDEGLDEVEDEVDMIMREQLLVPQDDSDDESYGPDNRGRSRRRSGQADSSQQEHVLYVVDRGLDLPPGAERPNLFDGHSVSWRRYNADEIGAYDAIMTKRSRDLAAHLYNAHVLRRRTRGIPRGKLEADPQAPPTVRKRWAAWPVHAAKVPRAGEILEERWNTSETLRMPPDPRPSAGLEECITAVMLKTSKERFQAREWNFEEINENSEQKLTDEDDLMEDELDKKEDEDEEPVDTRFLEPIVQLDDDASLRQLRPLVRNVISQVDRLLYGLHCAMKGRKYEEEDSGGEQSSDSKDEEDDTRESREQSRSRSRGRRQERGDTQERAMSLRSTSANTSTGPDTDDESLPGVSQSRARSRNSATGHDSSHSIKGRLKLRDWSEIMGLASMLGLPTAAVMRASKRCADLFGEDLEFRTLPEGRVRKKLKTGEQEEYVYTESEGESDWGSSSPSPQPTSFPTPVPPLIPARTPRPELEPKTKGKKPKQRRTKEKKTPAIVPASASPSPDPEAPVESAQGLTENAEQVGDKEAKSVRPGVGKGPHRKVDIVCPVRSCVRHTDGFSRKWNLNQHLKKSHGIYVAPGNELAEDNVVITIE
ncbi:uncharacterized protein N7515_001665 [Penicillium bovifimosum]|uniref:Rrn9 domain-containing protein n=1 Tax=Penicillium bovifimosum TaxID=126998 RepID=A0A9W9L8G7_9EURO|nr:uncharacterized protein N7515_001665 [Penicillium bovifimosum]KAJ5142878.1 hypothetical protein N7515_001665 [Penicillium bovifimosum]